MRQRVALAGTLCMDAAAMGINMFLAAIGYGVSQVMTVLERRLSRWK